MKTATIITITTNHGNFRYAMGPRNAKAMAAWLTKYGIAFTTATAPAESLVSLIDAQDMIYRAAGVNVPNPKPEPAFVMGEQEKAHWAAVAYDAEHNPDRVVMTGIIADGRNFQLLADGRKVYA